MPTAASRIRGLSTAAARYRTRTARSRHPLANRVRIVVAASVVAPGSGHVLWGAAYGTAAAQGLRGQKAVNSVFAVVYVGEVLLNSVLGFHRPKQRSRKDIAVDVLDKYLQVQGTGLVFNRLLDPAR